MELDRLVIEGLSPSASGVCLFPSIVLCIYVCSFE